MPTRQPGSLRITRLLQQKISGTSSKRDCSSNSGAHTTTSLPDFVEVIAAYPRVPQTLSLCTDDVFPDDLWGAGGLDDVLRRITRYGMPAIEALRAATLNAAFRLGRHDLGAVAPGRRADLAVFPDLRDYRADAVIFNGVEVCVQDSRPDQSGDQLARGLGLRSFSPEDFLVRAGSGPVRVATIDEPRFTRWGEAVASVADGYVRPPEGSISMAVVNRHGAETLPRVAFLRGWGAWRGAFCTTVSHDSHNLTVFGSNATDMAVAANAVRTAGGGLAAVSDGQVRAISAAARRRPGFRAATAGRGWRIHGREGGYGRNRDLEASLPRVQGLFRRIARLQSRAPSH